ncbi:FAD-dependent thymidylate synthase [Phormidium sp. FACHB-592]|uniref:FAD-dependent thymidylate synthase n=1 Tax=Stenomitos frigidus AS-A4 TaxID=2933935 RepID=A0ABV0KEW5_9CYAN|nr:FAD-dependent thymidylate synthase [Phormidium sp. FACHB-592]MBD2076357.1 FAD-dependent thymidylate synthase [Phormidium sp. FACHB-592]
MQAVEQKTDPLFRVAVIAKTPNPQQLVWISAHQCVCEGAAIDDAVPSEEDAGIYAVKHLLAGDRGHWSPLEAPQISFNVIGFNHRTMQQITRHRIGVHFSVQSLRYTSERFVEVAAIIQQAFDKREKLADEQLGRAVFENKHVQEAIEQVIYLRPEGEYSDRAGHKYYYDAAERMSDLTVCASSIIRYANKLEEGYSEEHAAGLLPMDCRQHWVMSANVRSLCHILDLRWKGDAQIEAQRLCDLMFPHFKEWVPAIAAYYEKARAKKARLSP